MCIHVHKQVLQQDQTPEFGGVKGFDPGFGRSLSDILEDVWMQHWIYEFIAGPYFTAEADYRLGDRLK